VADVVASWTQQSGFPLVTVSSPDPALLVIAQSRYLSDPAVVLTTNQTWWLPLSLSVGGSNSANNISSPGNESVSEKKIHLYLTPAPLVDLVVLLPPNGTSSIVLPSPLSAGQWYKINLGQTIPARVLYPASNLLAIGSSLLQNVYNLPAIDRSGILSDTFQFVRSGQVNISTALQYALVLQVESDPSVWFVAKTQLLAITRILAGAQHPSTASFSQYVGSLMTNQLAGTDNIIQKK